MGLKPPPEALVPLPVHLFRSAVGLLLASTIPSDDTCTAYANESFHKYVCIFL